MITWIPLEADGVGKLADPMTPALLRLPGASYIIAVGPMIEIRLYRGDGSVFPRRWDVRPADRLTDECALYDICLCLRRMAS
jgi:hypothetical protein